MPYYIFLSIQKEKGIISEELKERGIIIPKEEEMITKRVIHTSADFDYANTMTYSENAVSIAKELLKNSEQIKEIYRKCGFPDEASFFRFFKKEFGLTPKKYLLTFKIKLYGKSKTKSPQEIG